MKMSVHSENWKTLQAFQITGYRFDSLNVIVVELEQDGVVGRGEGTGIYYRDETQATMVEQLLAVQVDIEAGISREALLELLPAGGARNAVDCALWDLETKRAGRSVWELTGTVPKPLTSVYTIGLSEAPQAMAQQAKKAALYPFLKVKLDGDRPVERMRLIREARPDAALMIDVNQGWTFEQLQAVAPELKPLKISMIEQPLPRGADEALTDYDSPIPLCADESCLDRSELAAALSRYQIINIKLDKTGGLTEALYLAKAVQDAGAQLMVGNMLGTSLAMAPAYVIGQQCAYVDLDAPMFLCNDRAQAIGYRNNVLTIPTPQLWG